MGFLFGGGGSSQPPERLLKVQLQTSVYGQPVPIVYGTCRVPGNLIWLPDSDFKSEEVDQSVGKGGTVQSFTYSDSCMVALCEGPINSIIAVWTAGKTGFPATFSTPPFEVLNLGPRTNPTAWTFLTTNHPTQAVTYAGTAYAAAAKLNLPNGQPDNYNFHIQGLYGLYPHTFTGVFLVGTQTRYDAHPADVISDLLTNKDYGLSWDPAKLELVNGGSGTAVSGFSAYCHAYGAYLSPAITGQDTALTSLQTLLDITNSAAVWSQGVLKFIPYGDTALTANGHTFTPYLTAQYSLGPDDYIDLGTGSPVEITRRSLQETYNSYPVEYLDRTQEYKQSVAEDPEQADVELSGLRRASSYTAHAICRSDYALAISRIMAQKDVFYRNTYKLKLPQRYFLLEPMDIVELTEPKLGLVARPVRLLTVEEDDTGAFTCTAQDVFVGASTAVVYSGQANDGAGINSNADPGNANAPVIFVPTLQMTGGQLQIWLATNGGSAWGGAEVWVSDTGSNYTMAGTVGRCSYGTITSGISNSVSTIPVQLVTNSKALASTTSDGALDDLTATWLNGEVFSYQTATLTGANAYSLTGCLRGRQSTNAAAHSSSDPVVRLDSNVFRTTIASSRLGKTVYIKLVSFNQTGGGKQDISGLTPTTYVIPSTPTVLPSPTIVSLTIQATEF